MGRESIVTPTIRATSSMSHFFLKIATGEINHDVINEQLVGFIQSIATRYYTIDRDLRQAIIKGMQDGAYFNGRTLNEVEQRLNETIERITGEKYTNVAYFYTDLMETARKL